MGHGAGVAARRGLISEAAEPGQVAQGEPRPPSTVWTVRRALSGNGGPLDICQGGPDPEVRIGSFSHLLGIPRAQSPQWSGPLSPGTPRVSGTHTFYNPREMFRMLGAESAAPPLGLLMTAAHLPEEWELRFVDGDLDPITDADLQ